MTLPGEVVDDTGCSIDELCPCENAWKNHGAYVSAVSRVTNEKYVQTPRGVLALKFFFSSGLSTTSGEDVSARGIKAKIEKLVEDENPKKPLTDQAIVNLLKEEGVQIARRTVAKYREALRIPSSVQRRRDKATMVAMPVLDPLHGRFAQPLHDRGARDR